MHVFSDVRVWIGSFLVMWVSLFITYSKLVRARAKVKLYKDFLELREAQVRRLRAMKNEDNVLWEREWRSAKAEVQLNSKTDLLEAAIAGQETLQKTLAERDAVIEQLKRDYDQLGKRGWWIKQACQGDYGLCSNCSCRIPWVPHRYKYCPNCGSKMDMEVKHEAKGYRANK